MNNRILIYIIACFFGLQLIFFLLHQSQPQYNLMVLSVGNGLMAGLSIVTAMIVKKQAGSRPQDFVRGVYSATLLKLMVCLAAILVFVLLNRSNLHKPTLFVLFGIYVVYTGVETWHLS